MFGVVDKLTNGSLDGIPTSVMDPFERLVAWRKSAGVRLRDARRDSCTSPKTGPFVGAATALASAPGVVLAALGRP